MNKGTAKLFYSTRNVNILIRFRFSRNQNPNTHVCTVPNNVHRHNGLESKNKRMTIRWSFPHCRHSRSAWLTCGKNMFTLHRTWVYNTFVMAEKEPHHSCTSVLIQTYCIFRGTKPATVFMIQGWHKRHTLNPSISVVFSGLCAGIHSNSSKIEH